MIEYETSEATEERKMMGINKENRNSMMICFCSETFLAIVNYYTMEILVCTDALYVGFSQILLSLHRPFRQPAHKILLQKKIDDRHWKDADKASCSYQAYVVLVL